MPVIRGLIETSSGAVLPLGRITVQLRQPLIDRSTTPDALLTTQPASYTITNGQINSPALPSTTLGEISLPATVNELVSYRFTIERTTQESLYFLDDGSQYPSDAPRVTNGGFLWTGSQFISGESRRLTEVIRTTHTPILDPFDAILPDVSSIEIVDLVDFGAEFVSNPQAGLSYLAQLITSDTQYLNKLRAGRWVGPYSPAVVYQFGDIVSHGTPSQGWISKNASASTKIAPPSSGTVGNADWDYAPLVNVTNPSVDLTGLLQQTAADLLYLRLANVAQTIQGVKTFNSSPVFPTPSAGDNTTKAATTAFVQAAIAPIAGRLPDPIVVARAATHPAIIVGVSNLSFTQELVDELNAYNGVDFIVPTGGGDFEFEITIGVSWSGSTSSAGDNRVITRIYLFNFTTTTELGELWRLNENMASVANAGPIVNRFTGRRRVPSLTAGHVIVPRLQLTAPTGGTINAQSIEVASGAANNELRIWRA